MYLDAAKKQEIFGKYGKSNTDTGSAEAQIASEMRNLWICIKFNYSAAKHEAVAQG